jgi:hypothetical protein
VTAWWAVTPGLVLVLAGCAGLGPLRCEPPLVRRTQVVERRVAVNQGRQVITVPRTVVIEECVPPR